MTSVEFPGSGPLPVAEVRQIETTFYLTSGVAQGQIASRHWRLSDVLNTLQQQFLLLRDGILEQGSLPRDESAVTAPELVVQLDSVILAVESRTAGVERPASSLALRTPRTPTPVVLDAGPYRIRGRAHLAPGVPLLQHILDPNRPFMPVTDAEIQFRRNAAGGASGLPYGQNGVVRAPFLLVNRRHLIAVALAGQATSPTPRSPVEEAPPRVYEEYRRPPALPPVAPMTMPPPAPRAPEPRFLASGPFHEEEFEPLPPLHTPVQPPRPVLAEAQRERQAASADPAIPFTPADPEAAATLLRSGAVFRAVPDQPFRMMMHKLRRERLIQSLRFEDGEEIVRQGDDGHTLYVVAEGKVVVERTKVEGGATVLASLGAGDLFGEMAILGDGRRTATVRAVGPVETVAILQDGVRQILSAFPAATRPLLALLAARRAALQGS